MFGFKSEEELESQRILERAQVKYSGVTSINKVITEVKRVIQNYDFSKLIIVEPALGGAKIRIPNTIQDKMNRSNLAWTFYHQVEEAINDCGYISHRSETGVEILKIKS